MGGMGLMDWMDGWTFTVMGFKRQLLRGMFCVVETLTLLLPPLFVSAARLGVVEPESLIQFFPVCFLASFAALPLVSFGLKETDRRLAVVGFTTFFGLLLLAILFTAFQNYWGVHAMVRD